jgi:hypothetical protein
LFPQYENNAITEQNTKIRTKEREGEAAYIEKKKPFVYPKDKRK